MDGEGPVFRVVEAHSLEDNVSYSIKYDSVETVDLTTRRCLLLLKDDVLEKIYMPSSCQMPQYSLEGWTLRKISFPSFRPLYGIDYFFRFIQINSAKV